jgi:hypothetical protein
MSDLFEDISPDDFEAPDGVSWREWVRPVETVNKRLVSGEHSFYWEPKGSKPIPEDATGLTLLELIGVLVDRLAEVDGETKVVIQVLDKGDNMKGELLMISGAGFLLLDRPENELGDDEDEDDEE